MCSRLFLQLQNRFKSLRRMRVGARSLAFLSFALAVSVDAQTPAALATAPTESSQLASEVKLQVEKFQLANGLTVLLHEDHSSPIISYHTWFRVGSKDEEVGFTGLAHFFEHMMFKGAARYKEGEFDRILQENGASNNAFTTHDYTAYYENLPSSKLELVMDIESDRMQSLNVNKENYLAELEVVKEERRYRVDNNPMGLLYEMIFATSFRVHPYRWPVIGFMSDLERMTVEKLQEFYRLHYAPNNAVLVIAGDFDSARARKLVEKYYGAIPAQKMERKVLPKEPFQSAPRSQFLKKDVQNQSFVLAYPVPEAGTDAAYALDLLAYVLGKGNSSRLSKRLVYKEQTATSVSVNNYTTQDPGLFMVFVQMKPGVNFEKGQNSVLAEMWRPRNLLLSKEELEIAKKQTMKGYVDQLKTIYGKAQALAMNEILFGDYNALFRDLDRYNRVTAEDIRKAASKYLQPSSVNLAVIQPKSKKGE